MDTSPSRWATVRRGFLSWWQHDQVWWLPNISAEQSWHDTMGRHLALPASQFEHVAVIHIGTNGYAHGMGAKTVFPDKKIGTILDDYLHADSLGLVRAFAPPESIVGTAPHFADDGTVSYVELTMNFAVDARSGNSSALRWEEQLQPLFPPFTDHLPLKHLAAMMTIAKETSLDADAALRKATALACPYVQDGHSTADLAWFRPLVLERGENDGLRWTLDVATRQKLGVDETFSRDFEQYHLRDSSSIDEVLGSSAWQQFLSRQIPVRRAWGPIGLFWALLLDQLEGQRIETAVCARCGWILSGKRGKRFCSPEDRPNCHRARRAEDQQRSRARRKSRG